MTEQHPSALQQLTAAVTTTPTTITKTTYVYDGKEVFLTGRTAVRTIGEGTSREKSDLLHEIATYAPNIQSSSRAWVKLSTLFKVEGSLNDQPV